MLVSGFMRSPITALVAVGNAVHTSSPTTRLLAGITGGAAILAGIALLARTEDGDTPAAPKRPQLGFHQELAEGRTPAGGTYSIASYYGADRQPVDPDHAVFAEIAEFDDSGAVLGRTYLDVG